MATIEKDLGAVSAYAIAVENGFEGTVEEWLESLIGPMGYQGWSVSAVRATTTGQLIFTVTDPKTGETRELDPVQGDTIDALKEIEAALDDAKKQVQNSANSASESAVEAVEGAQNAGVQAVGDAKTAAIEAVTSAQTAAINAVSEAQTQATEAVGTAGNQALQDISAAKTSATGAVNTAGENAVNSVNSAGQAAVENAQTAINDTKGQAVTDVQNAGQSAVEKVQEAQTSAEQAVDTAKNSAVQAVENAGTAEAEKISNLLPIPTEADAGKVPVAQTNGQYVLKQQIDDNKTALDTTWSSQNIVSLICPPFEVSGSVVICQPIEGSNLNITSDSIDASTIFIAGKNLFSGVKSTTGSNVYFAQYNSNVWLKPDTTYTLSFNIQNAKEPFAVSVGVGDNAIPYRMDISRIDGVNNGFFKMTFKTSAVMSYHIMSIRAPRYTEAQSEISGELSEIQLEYSDNASPFEEYKGGSVEYNGESISIPVLSGTNTIFADAGNVTVSGYSDPTTIIKNLADRIAALEQNAIGG